jgi:hypothetical protein
MHFERLTKIQAPNLGLSINDNAGDAWVRLEGGQISLQSLQLDKGALLHLVADKDEVSLFVNRKSMRGTVTVFGVGSMTAGSKSGDTSVTRRYSLEVPETLEFVLSHPQAIPSRLTIHRPKRWNLGIIPVANLNFAMEEVRGITETEFTSGIKSGSIRFNDAAWRSIEISENELLTVNQTDEAAVELRSAEPLIHVTLNGVVKDVMVGRAEARTRMSPSYLEYFYNKKALAVFWGAVVFVWGILWGIRRTIFR